MSQSIMRLIGKLASTGSQKAFHGPYKRHATIETRLCRQIHQMWQDLSQQHRCFAAAAIPEQETASNSWLHVDPPVHQPVEYKPANPDSTAVPAGRLQDTGARPSQDAEPISGRVREGSKPNAHISFRELDSAISSKDYKPQTASRLAAAQVAEETADEESGDEPWDDERGFVLPPIGTQQKRYTPEGPKIFRMEKRRKGIGAQEKKGKLPNFYVMLSRLKAYKDKFGDCLVPKRYWEDYQLGDWGHRMRAMLRDKSLKADHFKALDRLSFPWTVPMEVAQWEHYCHELRRYKEEFGNTDIPFKWKDPMADFNNHFAHWFHQQPTLFLQRRLRPDQVLGSLATDSHTIIQYNIDKYPERNILMLPGAIYQVRKLMIAGFDLREVTGDTISKEDYIAAQGEVGLSEDKNEFEIMFAEFEAWKATYYTTVVPRHVWDNPVLGAWAWKVRKDYRNKKLAQWKVDRLEKLEILWKVDQQTAKWHALLHEARRYKEVHGTAHIPPEYKNPQEPEWGEAGRWLDRQAKLFRKQKLTDKRYRIIREILGIKFVRQYAPRIKENRERRGIWNDPSEAKKLPKYAPPIKRNIPI